MTTATNQIINNMLDALTCGHRTGNMIADLRDLDWHQSNDLPDAECVTDGHGNEVAWRYADGSLDVITDDGVAIETGVTLS